jgi:hypothetical protein
MRVLQEGASQINRSRKKKRTAPEKKKGGCGRPCCTISLTPPTNGQQETTRPKAEVHGCSRQAPAQHRFAASERAGRGKECRRKSGKKSDGGRRKGSRNERVTKAASCLLQRRQDPNRRQPRSWSRERRRKEGTKTRETRTKGRERERQASCSQAQTPGDGQRQLGGRVAAKLARGKGERHAGATTAHNR